MKHICLLFVFFFAISMSASAQKIALIDTKFKKPMLFTDSLTTNQLYAGYFPLQLSELDSFYASLEYFKELASVRQRIKMQSFEFRFGGVIIKTERVPMGFGDRYKIKMQNTIGNNTATYELSNGMFPNKLLVDKIEDYINYLKNEKTITLKPYTKAPHFYNVIVITDRY